MATKNPVSTLALYTLLAAVATGRGGRQLWIHHVSLWFHDMTKMTMNLEQAEMESCRGGITDLCW